MIAPNNNLEIILNLKPTLAKGRNFRNILQNLLNS